MAHDGANDELTGAVDAGLHAVLVDTPDSRQAGFVPGDWTGPRVTTVVEVEQLVCGG